eukprot:3593639-Prymnesium_polylepis.2
MRAPSLSPSSCGSQAGAARHGALGVMFACIVAVCRSRQPLLCAPSVMRSDCNSQAGAAALVEFLVEFQAAFRPASILARFDAERADRLLLLARDLRSCSM